MQLEFTEHAPAELHRVDCLFQQNVQEAAESDCDQEIFCSEMQSFRNAKKARNIALKIIMRNNGVSKV